VTACDLAVVGGGPAGTAAAITAARLGARVVLFAAPGEASRIPESLHPAGLSLLEELGLEDIESVCAGPAYARVWHWDGNPGSFGGEWRGRHVRRDLLDAALLRRAAEAGAAIVEARAQWQGADESGCRIAAGARAFDAGLVIDGSGAAQFLRRALNLERRKFSGPLVSARGMARGRSPHGDEPSFHRDEDGWTWIAPLGDGRAAWTRTSLKREAPRLPDGLQSEGESEAFGRAWQAVDAVAGAFHLLAGDAAGHLDPAGGDGVVLALESGRNAALAAMCARAGPAGRQAELQTYGRWWQARFAAKAKALAQIYAGAGLGRLLVRDAAG